MGMGLRPHVKVHSRSKVLRLLTLTKEISVDWRDLMKYPNEIYKMGPYIEVLDTAVELLPIKDRGDRTSNLIMWMADIREAGLISYAEHSNIATRMIHGPGGI